MIVEMFAKKKEDKIAIVVKFVRIIQNMPIVDLHGVVKLEKIYKMASVDKTCKVTNQLENSKDPHHSHLLIQHLPLMSVY